MTSQSVVLLGGGLDSLAALEFALAEEEKRPVWLFHFLYGNTPVGPLKAVAAISEYYRIPLRVLNLYDELPSEYAEGLLHSGDGVSQYLPDRNLMLLALVSAWTKSKDKAALTTCYAGFSVGAPSIYDITPHFVAAMNAVYALDQQSYFRVRAPFVNSPKTVVLQYLLNCSSPIELTYTCYLGEKLQCGECVTCLRRIEAFRQLKVRDPVPYRAIIDWSMCA